MKRIVCILCALALLLCLCACGKKTQDFFSSPEDVTIEVIRNITTVQYMLGFEGGIQIDVRSEDEVNAGAYANTVSFRYRYDGEKILFNELVDMDNTGEYTYNYYTSDLKEPYMFKDDSLEGISVLPLSDREKQNAMSQSLFISGDNSYEFTERTKTADGYRIGYDVSTGDRLLQHVDMDIDPVRGMVKSAVLYYYDYGLDAGMSTLDFTYNRNIRIDDSPRTKAIEQGLYDPNQTAAQEEPTETRTGSFNFACTDLDGKLHSLSDYTGTELIMISFWEPESPDCVDELAELQKLYADFGDSLTVLGVFSSEDEDAVRAAVREAGVSFPVLKCDNRLALYRGETVPCAIFVDNQGELLTTEPYFGVLSYSDWTTVLGSLQTETGE